MAVAILDVSADELAVAAAQLKATAASDEQGKVLAVTCDVTSIASCQAAQQEVAAAMPDKRVTFLFCNAGISGRGGLMMQGSADVWAPVFAVNVFGVVNTIKAFLPDVVAKGPLPSGKKAAVVCTSSVVGLLNNNVGPYSVSKMACTAVAEQLSLELDGMGSKAAHVTVHLLSPSPTNTGFFNAREADGKKSTGDAFKDKLAKGGASTPEDVVEGLLRGLRDGKFYVVLDHELDIPTSEQVALRMEDQMSGGKPRRPEQIGLFLRSQAEKDQRRALLARRREEASAPETRSRL